MHSSLGILNSTRRIWIMFVLIRSFNRVLPRSFHTERAEITCALFSELPSENQLHSQFQQVPKTRQLVAFETKRYHGQDACPSRGAQQVSRSIFYNTSWVRPVTYRATSASKFYLARRIGKFWLATSKRPHPRELTFFLGTLSLDENSAVQF